jgi:hypothetical protein
MRPAIRLVLLIVAFATFTAAAADAARVRVTHRRHHTRVTVRHGFPIHRTLPRVYVRPARVAVRVTPRVFLPPVVFGAAVVAAPDTDVQVWHGGEQLEGEDEWTQLTLNVDQGGTRLLLEVEDGPAKISFAEVVFDNGEAQVVDFADGAHQPGIYSLLDFPRGRKVDHVRVVATAVDDETGITVRLLR